MTTQARELAKLVNNSGDVNLVDDITLGSDGALLNFGADSDVVITHVADTGLLLNSSRQLQFGDSGTFIRQEADGVLAGVKTGYTDYLAGIGTSVFGLDVAIQYTTTSGYCLGTEDSLCAGGQHVVGIISAGF